MLGSAVNTLQSEERDSRLNRINGSPESKFSQFSIATDVKKQPSRPHSSYKSIYADSGGNSPRKRMMAEPTSAAWAAKSQVACDRLRDIKNMVDKAVREHKVFAMIGSFPSIRDSLKQRGWIEKTLPPRAKRKKALVPKSSSTACDDDNDDFSMATQEIASHTSIVPSKKSDSVLIARLLRQAPINFFWSMRSDSIDWKDLPKKQIVNRFPRAYFTTKVGLCSYLQQMHWYCETGVSQILFPRCYDIGPGDELTAFKNDYHLTACVSLLNWLITTFEVRGEKGISSLDGRIPVTVVEFAMARLQGYMSTQAHEDIDKLEGEHVWEHQWDQFLTCFYMITTGNHVLSSSNESISFRELYTRVKLTMQKLKKYWPQLGLDGMLNIWIVKPGNKSRGRGIILMNKLEDILSKVNPAIMKETRYVVQKYIEHPLLIHNTKFDIRQWFLVTSANPLTIWMYKESYLRFCSQTFNLKNMHESVHLCNNAIQARYKNGVRESADLPDENMWDCYTFKTYLKGIGHGEIWDELIYPGMREGIIGTLLASQEHMDRRHNCFELFGADFMLTEDFSPWLIEINSCPCMAPSTSVTARMCAQCLEDVIKVVVDRKSDRNASTGMFEMVYKQHIPPAPPYLGVSLAVRGQKIGKVNTHAKKKPHKRENSEDGDLLASTQTQAKAKIKRYVGPIVVDLIEDLARHLDKATRSNSIEPEVKPKQEKKVCPVHDKNGAGLKEKLSTPKKKAKKNTKKSTKSAKKVKKVSKPQVRGFTIEDDYQEEDFRDCLSHQAYNKPNAKWRSDFSQDRITKTKAKQSGSPLRSSLESLTENISSESSESSSSGNNSPKNNVFTPESLSPKNSMEDDQDNETDTASTKELTSSPESLSPTNIQGDILSTEPPLSNNNEENTLKKPKLDNFSTKVETNQPPENEGKKLYSDVSLKILSKHFQQSERKLPNERIDNSILKNPDDLLSEKLDHMQLSSHELLSKIKQLTANEYAAIEPASYPYSRTMNWNGHFNYKPTISDIVTKLTQNQTEKDIFVANKTKSQELIEKLSKTLFQEQDVRDLSKNTKDDTKRQPSFLDLKINDEFFIKKLEKSAKCPRIRIGLSPQVYNSVLERSLPSRPGLPVIRQKSTQKLANNSRSIENFYAVGMSLKSMQIQSGMTAKESLIMALSSLPSPIESHPAPTESTLA